MRRVRLRDHERIPLVDDALFQFGGEALLIRQRSGGAREILAASRGAVIRHRNTPRDSSSAMRFGSIPQSSSAMAAECSPMAGARNGVSAHREKLMGVRTCPKGPSKG